MLLPSLLSELPFAAAHPRLAKRECCPKKGSAADARRRDALGLELPRREGPARRSSLLLGFEKRDTMRYDTKAKLRDIKGNYTRFAGHILANFF